MELLVNGQKLDVQLEDEKTIGDVLKSFESESEKSGMATVSIAVDGKNITASEFDSAAAKPLRDDTKIELGVVSIAAIEDAFKTQAKDAQEISQQLKTISAKFQSGKDREANTIITRLADLVDNICHTASLSALFPKEFAQIKIDNKNFAEFFAEFSPILKDFEQAIESKDTVMIGDLSEYEISPRLDQFIDSIKAQSF